MITQRNSIGGATDAGAFAGQLTAPAGLGQQMDTSLEGGTPVGLAPGADGGAPTTSAL